MHITQSQTASGICMAVSGSLSGTEKSAIQLFETISIAIEKGPGEIILDLTKTIFIDSMAIGLLIGILLKCQEKKIRFRLANVPAQIKSILDAVNLKKIFNDLY
jgi:anti-anti-sigma factor